MVTREETLLKTVKKSDLIIEVGPSFAPLAPRAEGWNTKIVDHTDREGLIAKYTNDINVGSKISKIEEVDFVWRDGLLSSAVSDEWHGKFDIFLASHVIEHVPDVLGFLNSAQYLLSHTGTVVLAVPDKRYCFDYFRPFSTTADALTAHHEKRIRHTSRTLFDFMAHFSSVNGMSAWGQSSVGTFDFTHSIEDAYSLSLLADMRPESPYHDAHAWVFVPASFQLILLELARLGKTDWMIEEISPASGCEFHAWLKRGGIDAVAKLSTQEFNNKRLLLQRQILMETKEQIDFYLAGDVSIASVPAVHQELPVTHAKNNASLNAEFVDWFPRASNAIKIYEGEWSSAVPGFLSGSTRLFEDGRIDWFEEKLGTFSGQRVLELGPLEGGHSAMLAQRGANVLAIEANMRAYQRCLVVKELLGLSNVKFLLGDFLKYLDKNPPKFDFILASGVLYHMLDPVSVLQRMLRSADKIGIWTHYYDHETIQSREDLKIKFSDTPNIVKIGDKEIQLHDQYYLNALDWKGFCGGMKTSSVWMARHSILDVLEEAGFSYEIEMDHKDHPNGPAFCVFAEKCIEKIEA